MKRVGVRERVYVCIVWDWSSFLFAGGEKKMPGREFLLKASYLEIYNEVIRDLLCLENKDIKIREDLTVFIF